MNEGQFRDTSFRELLQTDRFLDEPVYCEATPQSPDDILYIGSDDEAYDSPSERRNRYEEQAQRYLAGKPVTLLSASLRGPFDRRSGWVNPWRSQSRVKKSSKRKRPSRVKRVQVPVPQESDEDPESYIAQVGDAPTQNISQDSSILRVQDWRNRVLAELDVNIPTQASSEWPKPDLSPIPQKHIAASPRKIHFRAPLALPEGGSSSSLSPPPSTADESEKPIKQLPDGIEQPIEQDEVPATTPGATATPCPSHKKPPLSPGLIPLDTTDLSPRAMKLYEQSFQSPFSQDEGLDAEASQPESPLKHRPPVAGLPVEKTAVATAVIRGGETTTHSLRTDGSFRYRRSRREPHRSSLGVKRSPSSEVEKEDGKDGENHGGQLSPDQALADKAGELTKDARATALSQNINCPQHITSAEPPTAEVDAQKEPESEQPDHPDQANAEGSPTPSQIDGITLVAPESTGSGRSSRGNFSAEKASQDEISLALSGFPKRLLWPNAKSGLDSGQSSMLSKPPSSPAVFSPAPFTLRIRSPAQPSCSSPIHQIESRPISGQEAIPTTLAGFSPITVKPMPEIASRAVAGLHALRTALEPPSTPTKDGQVGVQTKLAPNMALKSERPSPTPTPVLLRTPLIPVEAPVQSPWADEAPPLPPAVVNLSSISHDEAEASRSAQTQSPWARGDSQIAELPRAGIRPFDSLSSPANSTVLPQATTTPPPPAPHETSSQIILTNPSTPESKNSGLPTPEFTLSAKSARGLTTPLPLPAAKRRRISTEPEESERRLLSTQRLVDATISNPWSSVLRSSTQQKKSGAQRPKKPRKSVTFAPFPGDPVQLASSAIMTSSPSGAELLTATPVTRPRTTSPPPPILSTEPLPSTNEKFGKHFAKVTTERAVGIRTPTGTTTRRPLSRSQREPAVAAPLLPSESQQICPSPAVDAMAEAFLTADKHLQHSVSTPLHPIGSVTNAPFQQLSTPFSFHTPSLLRSSVTTTPLPQSSSYSEQEEGDTVQIDIEAMVNGAVSPERNEPVAVVDHHQTQPQEAVTEKQQHHCTNSSNKQSPFRGENSFIIKEEEEGIDDVSAVLENLDDFLGQSWDLEADMRRVRGENRRSIGGGGMDLDLDGGW